MTKGANFTKLRFIMFSISLALILTGLVGTIQRGGFNLGIDFRAGLSQRIQISDIAARLTYQEDSEATVELTGTGLTLVVVEGGESQRWSYPFAEYPTLGSLVEGIGEVPGVSIDLVAQAGVSSSELLGLTHVTTLSNEPVVINYIDTGRGDVASIDQLRTILQPLGTPQIQSVGNSLDQEFIIRVLDSGNDPDFRSNVSSQILALLEGEYGAGRVAVKQNDYVGPRFSGELGGQTITLTLLAVVLILLYVWIRFRLAFAISAIVALIHDVLIMIGFIGFFQVEVVTATVAAVLTIIGYSLNDTIVVFDRIRENSRLIHGAESSAIINLSITQSLSRTLITSITTLLAVVTLYIMGSGPIRDFALAMIVGIVVGTYSSIYIASPVLLGFLNSAQKRRKRLESEKYGGHSGVRAATVAKPDTGSRGKGDGGAAPAIEVATVQQVQRRLKGKRRSKR